ncbi:MAG: hypothetical protein AAF723_10535, partial [Pseudomonadota bacterium]
HFRTEFWKEVSRHPKLMQGFDPGSASLVKRGFAPYTTNRQKLGARKRYEIDHVHELQDGGNVYDMNNLVIRTPLNHVKGK